MRDSVRDYFGTFQASFEGRVPNLYLDVKGLVTIGIGCLVDPLSEALKLPLKWPSGRLAIQQEITDAWSRVKARQDLKDLRADLARWGDLSALRLTVADIDTLMVTRATQFEVILRRTFPFYDSWPADAQLGVLSMSWAMGAGFTKEYVHFTNACLAGNFIAAADECKIGEEGNAGIPPRNRANKILFRNAAAVLAAHNTIADLYYPKNLSPMPDQQNSPSQQNPPAPVEITDTQRLEWLMAHNLETLFIPDREAIDNWIRKGRQS